MARQTGSKGKIKVWFVIDHLGGGGAQESLYQICKFLKDDFILNVCALHSGGIYKKRLEDLGISVEVLALSRHFLFWPVVVVRLLYMLWHRQFDVINTFLQVSFLLTTPLASLAGIPLAHTLMANNNQTQRWYFPLMKIYQRMVSAYLVYDWQEIFSLGIPDEKIIVVELPFDLSPFRSLQHNASRPIEGVDLQNSFPVLLSIGRLHPDKGHEYVIRSLPHILRQHPASKVLIVGSGEQEEHLKSLARRLGISTSVVFTGYRTDLDALFERADIFIRASINEGVNTITAFAMASGLPVVGFKNSVKRDFLINDVSGVSVPIGHLTLAEGILRLLQDESLREKVQATARKGIVQYYDVERIMQVHKDTYLALARGASVASIKDMRDEIWPWRVPFLDRGEKDE